MKFIEYEQSTTDSFFPEDDQGFLIPPLQSVEHIKPLNRIIIERVVQLCRIRLRDDLLSVYFRGSQLLNEYKSDFDTVVVVKDSASISTSILSSYLNEALQSKFYHIVAFDCLVIKESEVLNNYQYQFIIKVLSINVYGKPLEKPLANFVASQQIAFTLLNRKEKYRRVVNHLLEKSTSDKKVIINYSIKFLIRASFELIIDKEKKYTRDLITCQRVFVKYFPEHSDISLKLLNYYNIDKVNVKEFLSTFQEFYTIIDSNINLQ